MANTPKEAGLHNMKTLRALGVLAATASALALIPVTAATAADTTTTFTIAGGDLTLTAAPTADLGSAGTGAPTISGSLGAVGVDDARGGTVGWTATAVSTAFSQGLGPDSTGVTYTTGTVGSTGSVTVAGSTGMAVNTTATVVTASDVTGNNTASWTPQLTVALPSTALAGDYTGTVTTSVS
jgi:hypothetical protein